jgi:HTH-like domain
MRRIDELFTTWPFLGSRRMARLVAEDGRPINRKHVQRLMRLMGIADGNLSGAGTVKGPCRSAWYYD